MPSLRSLLATLGGVTIFYTAVASSNPDHAQQSPLASDDPYICEHPPYRVSLISQSPLIIYLQNFITPSERAHLLQLGCVPLFLSLSHRMETRH